MIMRRMSFVLCAIVALCVFAGCSVKEDRSLCPSRMVLDFTGLDTDMIGSVCLLGTGPDGIVLRDHVKSSDFDKTYVREMPYGKLRLNFWSGADGYISDKDGLVIPFGDECPAVYMSSSEHEVVEERWEHKVSLKKNYCCITVAVIGMDTMPYGLSLSGNVKGYGLDGSPLEGEYGFIAYPGEDGKAVIRVPRQLDASLMLIVDDSNMVRKSFALGEYIAESGYDWTADELEDISVTLDFSVSYSTLIINKWDEEYVFDIVL